MSAGLHPVVPGPESERPALGHDRHATVLVGTLPVALLGVAAWLFLTGGPAVQAFSGFVVVAAAGVGAFGMDRVGAFTRTTTEPVVEDWA